MQAAATILIGIIVSMYYTWEMTLVSLVSVPMVIVAVVLEGRVLAEGIATIREASNKATTIATEAITNIRTVSAFCKFFFLFLILTAKSTLLPIRDLTQLAF